MELGDAFDRALLFAAEHHRSQRRKLSGAPYLGHLLGVTSLVLDDGGSEAEAIAALLHDAIEDSPDPAVTSADLRREFGPEVHRIVVACTDSFEQPKRPWGERKRTFLASLAGVDAPVRRVVAADKLHNARTLVHELRAAGEEAFSHFTATRGETLWYYRSVADALAADAPSPLVDELARAVEELERLAG
jgi:(p)ppGpp synthase/HD superfamily hydrolase